MLARAHIKRRREDVITRHTHTEFTLLGSSIKTLKGIIDKIGADILSSKGLFPTCT